MPVTVIDCEQRSPEWHDARRGILTASSVAQLITVGPPDATSVSCPRCGAEECSPCVSMARKEPAPIARVHDERTKSASTLPPQYTVSDTDTSRALVYKLAAERITGWTDPTFTTGDMLRGQMDEPLARAHYVEHYAPYEVTETGIIIRSEPEWTLGYSPDGLVGEVGLIEVKSRLSKIHLAHVVEGQIAAAHMAQMQAGLLVTGRAWCDYLSWCGGMPMWPTRVLPDHQWQQAIIAAAIHVEQQITKVLASWREATTGLPSTTRIDYDQEIF